MPRYKGIVLAPGFSKGRAWVLSPVLERAVPRYDVPEEDREREVKRLAEAAAHARDDLELLKDRLAMQSEEAETGVLDAHIAMLEDPVFFSKVRARIRTKGVNAEQAVSDEIDGTAALFETLKNAYLRERSDDLRDVGQRLIDGLTGNRREAEEVELPEGSILVAHELLPSQAAGIDRTRVVGIVTESGGSSSHAAILARSLGVPFVSAVHDAVRHIPQGARLLVDGDRGEVVLQPAAAESRTFNRRMEDYERFLAHTRLEELEPSHTKDGVAVELMGNVASLADADAVIDHRLAGIGLLRTEFMFMAAEKAPGIAKQQRAYGRIIERVGALPVIVRCMDLGADKMPLFLQRNLESGELPSARGLRFALEHPKLLIKQLRAVMRCASIGSVRILLPMVAGLDDFERALDLIDQAAAKEGLEKPPPVGAMIETPAAVFEIEAILDRADFVSVGTNDLTQFMMAVDRSATDAEGFYSVLYPGVIRALNVLIEACGKAGRPISVCGEAAGNPQIAALLVGLGLRDLSMSPVRAAAVRHVIRSFPLAGFEDLAKEILGFQHVRETKALLDERIKPLLQSDL